jgi:hypothetical protein
VRHCIDWFVAALLTAAVACGCGEEARELEPGGDDDTDSSTDYTGPAGTMGGTVLAPNGSIPISGALIYISGSSGPEIPDSAYCYECEDMTGKTWTLSGADGTWHLDNVPTGQHNLIVRKGFFQRQRSVTVEADTHLDVPAEYTTLPADNSDDGLDQIPNYAVLMAYPDQIFDLLAKIGMGQLSSGSLQFGTETFDLYNDDIYQAGYESSEMLFFDEETLNHYHMIFLPCYSSATGLAFPEGHREMIRDYVSGGGKIYNSCCVAHWTEPTFPEYLEFYGDDAAYTWDIGRISPSALSTVGTINDSGLRDWFAVVLPSSDPDAVGFQNGYTRVDDLIPTDDGHGTEEDNGVVVPYSWVDGSGSDDYTGYPLMTTYNYDCGKIFYSVYETSPEGSATLIPQEYLLLYIILEVGVCEGDYGVE